MTVKYQLVFEENFISKCAHIHSCFLVFRLSRLSN